MAKINQNYLKLQKNYLFADIDKKLNEYKANNPDADIIKMGIGDVTLPLPSSAVEAMKKASDELGEKKTFQGYPPYYGYDFLREAIANLYKDYGVEISPEEVYVSDGAKSDSANIQEIFDKDTKIALGDPVYPVYLDTNVIAERSGQFDNDIWSNICYLPVCAENNFIPELPKEKCDLIYVCSPNNPTGTALNRVELKKWVDYAKENNSIILFDSAYKDYITEPDIPHSIYEIEGARDVAIEMCSFSKSAAFTGTRCAYTIIPDQLKFEDGTKIKDVWERRQATKFNGVAYIIQRGAEAVLTESGKKEVEEIIAYYMNNAKIMKQGLEDAGFEVYGGINSPYVWLKTKDNMTSWEFFDYLLSKANIVGTPGSGFGPHGEHYFRLTAFNSLENTKEAIERIKNIAD